VVRAVAFPPVLKPAPLGRSRSDARSGVWLRLGAAGAARSGTRAAGAAASGAGRGASGARAGVARDADGFPEREAEVVEGADRDPSGDGNLTVPEPAPPVTDLPHSRHLTIPGRNSESQWGHTSGVDAALGVGADAAVVAAGVLAPFVPFPGFQPHSRQRNIPTRSSFPQSGHSVNSVPVAILRPPPWRSARPVATPVRPQAEAPPQTFHTRRVENVCYDALRKGTFGNQDERPQLTDSSRLLCELFTSNTTLAPGRRIASKGLDLISRASDSGVERRTFSSDAIRCR
jgi:hypothetical protein